IVVANQTVTNGLFAVQLDFGLSAFQGSSRWLEIAVKPASGGNYTTLSPRQALTAAPYAMSLVPGAVVTGTLPEGASTLMANNTGAGNGIYSVTSGGVASAGLYAESTGVNSTGVIGVANNGSLAYGVWGSSNSGYGVVGTSSGPAAGYFSGAGNGVYAES